MLFVDEITEFNRFKEIYKSRNKFILKIDKLKFTKLNEIIYKCIFYYMKIFNKNIKKIIDLDDDGLKLNILYIINEKNEKLKFVENNKIKNRLISKINIRREKRISILLKFWIWTKSVVLFNKKLMRKNQKETKSVDKSLF